MPVSSSADASLLQLPLTYEPALSGVVRQHWDMTFSRQRRISVYGKRIMARVLEQISKDDFQLREFYQLRTVSLLDEADDHNGAYVFAKRALYELARVQWEFEDKETQTWYVRSLLDTTQERRVGIKEGIITVILNPQLAPYFVQIAGRFSTYNLNGYLGLSSWYSMRLYEMLSAWRDTGWWEVSIEEYRQLMDCGPELDKLGQPKKNKQGEVKMKEAKITHLLERTMAKAQEELANTPLAFTCVQLTAAATGKGRPKVVKLRFELLNQAPTAIPPSWLEVPAVAAAVGKLRGFRVSERNIATYLKPLGLAAASELVRTWQIKEQSNNRINEKEKYCNAAFTRAGEKAVAAQRQAATDLKQETKEARKMVQQVLFPR